MGIINATNHTISFPATETTLISSSPSEISACYDSGSNCGIVAFADGGASDHGKVFRVSIKSDNTLNVGTALTFHSAGTSRIAISYVPTKFMSVIAYCDDDASEAGKCIGIRVNSNNNLQLGLTTSESTFENGAAKHIAMCETPTPNVSELFYKTVDDAILDVNNIRGVVGYNHQLIIAYKDSDDSGNQQPCMAVIPHVDTSHNSSAITYPKSPDVIRAGNMTQMAIEYDPINQMCLLAFINASGNLTFRLIEPSFSGDGVIGFNASFTDPEISLDGDGDSSVDANPHIVWDKETTISGESKFIIAYTNESNNSYGELRHVTGHVSTGLSTPEPGEVTHGNAIVFSNNTIANLSTRQNAICRDTVNDKFIIAYQNGTNNRGDVVVYQPAKTNLLTSYQSIGENSLNRGRLSSNFIGIATTAASDGETVTIKTQGKVGNQSNLTKGLLYAVHSDGTLREYVDTLAQVTVGNYYINATTTVPTHGGARIFDQNDNVISPGGIIVGTAISSTEILVGEK